jgi:hypothetical protein
MFIKLDVPNKFTVSKRNNKMKIKQFGIFLGLSSVVTMTALAMTGCGGAKSLINNAIPEVDNLLKLNDSEIDTNVGGVTRAVIVGGLDKSHTFPDRDLPEGNRLNFVRLRQGLHQNVRVTVPEGAPLPATFTLSNITLETQVSDMEGDVKRGVEGNATITGPVIFTQVGSSNDYATTSVMEPEIGFSADPFRTFRAIVTTAPNPNSVNVKLRFDADDTQLPTGSVIRFKFVGGKAKVGI